MPCINGSRLCQTPSFYANLKSMTKIIFSITFDDEKEYLKELLNEREWFEKNDFPVLLPPKNGISVGEIINEEKPILKIKLPTLKEKWEIIEESFFQVLKNFKNTEIVSRYHCHLSIYGPEGKYFSPDWLFVRVSNNKDDERFLETVAHEIVHLAFSNFLKENNLDYEKSEIFVDQILMSTKLNKMFPDYKPQNFVSNQKVNDLLKSCQID